MAHTPLTTPTHDGSGEATHPSAVKVGSTYWMAISPTVDFGASPPIEPIDILSSTDRTTWVVPDGLTNPVVPDPVDGDLYVSDHDLVHDDGLLHLFYRETEIGVEDRLRLVTSPDGVEWSASSILLTADELDLVSPSLVHHDGLWYLWAVHGDTSELTMHMRTAPSPEGPWSAEQPCTVAVAEGRGIWHIDISRDSGLWRAFLLTRDDTVVEDLVVIPASSVDGLDWVVGDAVIVGDGGSWPEVYRASGVREGDTWHVWHGIQDGVGDWDEWTWRIAYSALDAGDFPATVRGVMSAWPSMRPGG